MTAFEHVINKRGDIYVDLAVFVPDGELMAKFVRMRAARLMPGGTIQVTEVFGPPNVKMWRRAFDMFRTCCLMWDVMTAETLDMYAEAIELLVDRYGANLWPLYLPSRRQDQADSRAPCSA